MATLTSSNSTLAIGVEKLFNIPVTIEGYSVDDAFAVEEAETSEVLMGVDGKLSGGYTPYPVVFSVNLQADSKSNLFFDTLIQTSAIKREAYILNATILIPSIGFIYALTHGFLGKTSLMPEAKKILQPRKYEITFQSITRAPV